MCVCLSQHECLLSRKWAKCSSSLTASTRVQVSLSLSLSAGSCHSSARPSLVLHSLHSLFLSPFPRYAFGTVYLAQPSAQPCLVRLAHLSLSLWTLRSAVEPRRPKVRTVGSWTNRLSVRRRATRAITRPTCGCVSSLPLDPLGPYQQSLSILISVCSICCQLSISIDLERTAHGCFKVCPCLSCLATRARAESILWLTRGLNS